MWRSRALAGASILGLIVLSPPLSTKVVEGQGAKEQSPEPPGDATDADFYAYFPPDDRGKPKVRVSGATRGPGSPPELEALIPEDQPKCLSRRLEWRSGGGGG